MIRRRYLKKESNSPLEAKRDIRRAMLSLGWDLVGPSSSDGLRERFEKDGNVVDITVDTYTCTVSVNGKKCPPIEIDRIQSYEWKSNLDNWINKLLSKNEAKSVTEGYVSDDSHNLWVNLGYDIAAQLDCDVWLNDMGWMNLSNDAWNDEITLYTRWDGDAGTADVVAVNGREEKVCGSCRFDVLNTGKIIANLKRFVVSM